MKDTQKQIIKFVLIGISAVTFDFITYYFLSFFIGTDLAKTIGFITGSVYTFYMNKFWTWKNRERTTRRMAISFIILYSFSLCINVLINKLMLWLIPDDVLYMRFLRPGSEFLANYGIRLDKFIAFFVATLTSAVFNFSGQKRFVFNETSKDTQSDSDPLDV